MLVSSSASMDLNTSRRQRRKKIEFGTRKKECKSHVQTDIKVYFIAWEGAAMNFIDGVKFTEPQETTKVHLFYAKGTPADRLPMSANWIIGHESLTNSKDAEWVDLTAYVTSFYARLAIDAKCQYCSTGNIKPRYNMRLVCCRDEKSRELIAVMRANDVELTVIDGRKESFLDMFEHVCNPCRLIFNRKSQATQHDCQSHNFLCRNIKCERSRRGNGFYLQPELEHHEESQKSCDYCPSEIFCSEHQLSRHIRDNHRQCPCPCGEYYARDDEFIEHFYARYPLPCLEKHACEARFKDIEAQAFHHQSVHGAVNPFYCMACFKQKIIVCLKTSEELMEHVDERNHGDKDFKFALIPQSVLEGNI